MASYLDTSALAKWYLNEPRSEEFEAYLSVVEEPLISTLTVVEMRSLLSRHRRSGSFNERMEARIFSQFQEDVEQGHIFLRPVKDNAVMAAAHILARLSPVGVRTLDAIHLSIAQGLGASELASADLVMCAAAKELGMNVVGFSS